jgi:hypothetical protein
MLQLVEVQNKETYVIAKFQEVLSEEDTMLGKKAKSCYKPFSTDFSAEVGQEFHTLAIRIVDSDTPQFEGHKIYEKTGKYYQSKLWSITRNDWY